MRVVVPIDDSDPAREALEHTITTFRTPRSRYYTINPSLVMRHGEMAYDYERLMGLEEEEAETLFETAREIADDHDASVTTEIVIGRPSRGIVEFATENDVDQIVLGSHGRSGVSRVLLGSVAERVVRRAPVPVTVVR